MVEGEDLVSNSSWKTLMAQSLEELHCYAAEGPGMFQYIPPVASVTPASIQLGQRPGNLQSSVYSAGVGSSLVLLLPCHSDSIIQVGTFLGSPTQKLHPILWPTGCLPRMSSQGLDLNPVNFLAIYTQFWILPQKFFLGSLNLWWVCIPQNSQEACATCGDTNIRAPERRSYN